jgi:hypothetical protein
MYFLDEIKPRIFLALFNDHYHLTNVFLRFQEGTESPDSKFRDYNFTISQWQESYIKSGPNLNFDYFEKWMGFALQGDRIKEIIDRGFIDLNKWDQTMLSFYSLCANQYPDLNFVIIGLSRNELGSVDEVVLKHEMAHAFYATNPKYKQKVHALIKKLPNDLKDSMYQVLASWDYDADCLDDELHAYLSEEHITNEEFLVLDKTLSLKKHKKPFIELLQQQLDSDFKRRTLIPKEEI